MNRARWMWEQKMGPIPEGLLVHHKNECSTDDRMENFELTDRSDHINDHNFSDVIIDEDDVACDDHVPFDLGENSSDERDGMLGE